MHVDGTRTHASFPVDKSFHCGITCKDDNYVVETAGNFHGSELIPCDFSEYLQGGKMLGCGRIDEFYGDLPGSCNAELLFFTIYGIPVVTEVCMSNCRVKCVDIT